MSLEPDDADPFRRHGNLNFRSSKGLVQLLPVVARYVVVFRGLLQLPRLLLFHLVVAVLLLFYLVVAVLLLFHLVVAVLGGALKINSGPWAALVERSPFGLTTQEQTRLGATGDFEPSKCC